MTLYNLYNCIKVYINIIKRQSLLKRVKHIIILVANTYYRLWFRI